LSSSSASTVRVANLTGWTDRPPRRHWLARIAAPVGEPRSAWREAPSPIAALPLGARNV